MIPMAAAIEAVDRVCEQLGVILDSKEAKKRAVADQLDRQFADLERAFFGLGGE
jgi:hypothetical protein